MITSHIIGTQISSNENQARTLANSSLIGEVKGEKTFYSNYEALFLVEQKKMKILQGNNEVSAEELIKKLTKGNKEFQEKYSVFKDLRKKGHIVKTGLKFGAEFRVYQKGTRPGKGHAEWIVYVNKERDKLTLHEFAAKNRVAHSTKKKLLLAIVDSEDSVSYYEVQWKKI